MMVHNSSPSRVSVGKLPGGNFRCLGVGKAVGSYDIEFISYDPTILEIIEG